MNLSIDMLDAVKRTDSRARFFRDDER